MCTCPVLCGQASQLHVVAFLALLLPSPPSHWQLGTTFVLFSYPRHFPPHPPTPPTNQRTQHNQQQSISDCSLNPLTRDHLASPVAVTNLKTMGLKMVMVIVSTSLSVLGRTQAIIMLICAAIITYFLARTVGCAGGGGGGGIKREGGVSRGWPYTGRGEAGRC